MIRNYALRANNDWSVAKLLGSHRSQIVEIVRNNVTIVCTLWEAVH